MRFYILTLFPEMIEGFFTQSIINRGIKNKRIGVELHNLRDWGIGKRKQVDDTPYGGGAGMVLRFDVLLSAINSIKEKSKPCPLKTILLTPQGQTFNQKKAIELANQEKDLLLICGHYEGFDERIRDYVEEEISIGDYILTGGELPAAVIVDAVARLIPGVLGKKESLKLESFFSSLGDQNLTNSGKGLLLEYPQYTKPEKFDGKKVPKVLLSGNHALIEKWRKEAALKRTQQRRPDLLK